MPSDVTARSFKRTSKLQFVGVKLKYVTCRHFGNTAENATGRCATPPVQMLMNISFSELFRLLRRGSFRKCDYSANNIARFVRPTGKKFLSGAGVVEPVPKKTCLIAQLRIPTANRKWFRTVWVPRRPLCQAINRNACLIKDSVFDGSCRLLSELWKRGKCTEWPIRTERN